MNRRSRRFPLPVFLALVTACGAPGDTADPSAPEAAISANLTKPPMGWDSWNTFAQAIDFNVIKAQADAMVASGMKDAGYEYVNLDAGWWLGTRDAQGNITIDQAKWPGGMKAVADYIHSKGLKAGIYTDAGKNGCINWWPTNGPRGPNTGSEGHYDRDFLQFSQWGFDYVKVDWCGGRDEGLNARNTYTAISAAIDRATAHTGRPMVLSICEWGANQPWTWAPAISSLWRTSDDIIFFGEAPSMDRVLRNFDSALHPEAQSPGHYNDPDMMMVGMPGFTAAQNRTHMGLWAILSAPLIAGNNLATMSAETRAILTNRDVLAVHADPLARTPVRVSDVSGRQVYNKVLSGAGRRAVALLNRTTSAGSITVRWSDLGLTSGSAQVRNLWTGQDLGTIATSYTVTVPAREAVLLLVTDATSVVGGPVSLNAGGTASGSWVADTGFSGGSTYSVTTAIDTAQLSGTIPPQAVLQTERYGEFTYTLGGFGAGSAQAVTLYFAEVYWTAAGQRTFNVAINGATVLSAFDIFAAAGGAG
ncbi:MAG TPA: malectin domain-containing carbohydrate-binding protein, partial [Anaeromyxobacter sp.]|nr:malectin domain-containing carbohydrate-binding protein [Anaeromyxobacter sp.]